MSAVPLSILDLASISAGDSVGQSLQNCVTLAQRAEELGFTRVWYAEHHNFESIASSAPSVLIAHVAAHTNSIRLGSGGIMLPNHSPLVVAEQFGTLASLHPSRGAASCRLARARGEARRIRCGGRPYADEPPAQPKTSQMTLWSCRHFFLTHRELPV